MYASRGLLIINYQTHSCRGISVAASCTFPKSLVKEDLEVPPEGRGTDWEIDVETRPGGSENTSYVRVGKNAVI